jgi:uncharacterized membrane protein
MNLMRIFKHFFTGQLAVRRMFPCASLNAIEKIIEQSETGNNGEIVFAIEDSLSLMPLLSGQSARERAIEVFSLLRVWDTQQDNGVLVYLLLADHDIEIVADRGIDAKVSKENWEVICHEMEAAFREGRYDAGVMMGISKIGHLLRQYFPIVMQDEKRNNELSDKPVIL